MKKIIILIILISQGSCTETESNVDKLDFPTNESIISSQINLPFRYNFLEFNGITKEGMLNWEGKMFDYDKNGIADMVSTGTDIMIVENKRNGGDLYTLTKKIKVSDFIDYDEVKLWTTQGVVYDFNKDGKYDHFFGLVGERPGVFNRGGTYLLLSDGNTFKGRTIDERPMFRFDDTFTLIDYNRDGFMDVLADFDFIIYQNNGNNTFTIIENPFPRLTTRPGWLQTRVDDLNGDGFNDIIGVAFQGLEIHFGTSDYKVFNSWYKEWNELTGWNGADVTIANLDKTGHKEILVTYSNWKDKSYTRLFKFNGVDYFMDINSEFHAEIRVNEWDSELKTSAWDFDKDGDDDIFFQQINEYTNFYFENIGGVLVKKSIK